MSTETPRQHHQPRVAFRAAQPYVAITARATTEAAFRAAVDRDMPAVFRWAAARGLPPVGPPFIRCLAGAHDVVHEWAASEGLTVARRPVAGGTAFGGAVEHFRAGPFEEHDPWRWEIDVAYLLVDDR